MIKTEYRELPDGIDGLTFKHDDLFTIWIDSRLSEKKRVLTEIHELGHILLGHFDDGCTLSADDCELRCNEYVEELIGL